MRKDPLWRPYTQMKTAAPPLRAARTEGSRIVLDDGRVLVDGIASWWTACHGYNHPVIREAVAAQLARMPHVMFGGLTHAGAERLAERLSPLLPAPGGHVFFTDSGSVAVEVALKMALQSRRNRGETRRTRFLAFLGGYHGDTLGAMSVSDPEEGMHASFSGALLRQSFARLPTDAAAERALSELLGREGPDLAAVILEPRVQGAGGMIFHDAETLRRVERLARAHGLLLIADEIFTGFGRTGEMTACAAAGVSPDILCLSKALTGGTTPLAATIASRAVFDAFWSDAPGDALMHGPTFMANPLACAAANASLDLFEAEPRLEEARRLEGWLREGLAPAADLPGVREVRVLGAIGVVELEAEPDLARLKAAFVERGAFIRPFGRTVYLTPALNIPQADVEFLCAAIRDTLAADAAGRAAQ